MEQSCFGKDESDFSLKEWGLKAKTSRANTSSRRFSESNLRSFRENAMPFRSNITISSIASSPGYVYTGEIVPSTYSFTTALKALQAKTVYTWEHVSPDGYSLNSKWNDAEKYICNPLSGQVPMECLSAKTLSERSFRVANRISMPHINAKVTSQVLEKRRNSTRDVGTQSKSVDLSLPHSKLKNLTQSKSVDLSSRNPSPAPTPSIGERSIKTNESDTSISSEIEVKETREKQSTKRNGRGERKEQMKSGCSYTQWGCLSVWRMTTVRQQNKHNGCSK